MNQEDEFLAAFGHPLVVLEEAVAKRNAQFDYLEKLAPKDPTLDYFESEEFAIHDQIRALVRDHHAKIIRALIPVRTKYLSDLEGSAIADRKRK